MKKVIVALIMFVFGSSLYAAERVPGTNVSLDPPPGFVRATKFPGYIMESTGALIMITNIPGPFSEVSKGFEKEGLANQGILLIDRQDVKVASGNAILSHVSQSANGIQYLKWLLGFGDEQKTVLVIATFPKQFESDLSEKLKKAVLSAEWNK